MEDVLYTCLSKLQELHTSINTALPDYWAGIIAYGIPFKLLYVADRTIKSAKKHRTALQNNALSSVWGLYFMVSFFITPQLILYSIDAFVVFFAYYDIAMIACDTLSIFCIVSIYTSLFKLITFTKHGLLSTKAILAITPFIYFISFYLLYTYSGFLNNKLDPFNLGPEYKRTFITGCILTVPPLVFLFFSKPIRAAWAEIHASAKKAHPAPRG